MAAINTKECVCDICLYHWMLFRMKITPIFRYGYEPIGAMCYMMAVICVLYCQESFYRLNATISAIFLVVGAQQLFMPKMKKRGDVQVNDADVELMDRVRRLKEDMVASEMEKADACASTAIE